MRTTQQAQIGRSSGFRRFVSLVCNFGFLLALFYTAPVTLVAEKSETSVEQLVVFDFVKDLRRLAPLKSPDVVTITVADVRCPQQPACARRPACGHMHSNGLCAPLLC